MDIINIIRFIIYLLTLDFEQIQSSTGKFGPMFSSKTILIIFTILLYLAFIMLLVTIVRMIIKQVNSFFILPNKKKQDYLRNALGADFKDCLTSKSIFIDTYFQNVPPNRYSDPLESLKNDARTRMINHYLKKILIKSNTPNPLICVLGDSGTGKTSFLVNLVKQYVAKYTEINRPYNVRLLSLANDNFSSQINGITDKENTVLLLDALDENKEANNDYEVFINTLEELIRPFAIVVITCRTQFFPNEEAEPKESKILNPLARDKGFYSYTRHYISPFSDDDVNKYLKKKYGLKLSKKRKAKRIISNCDSLACRPLLLSYINDLVLCNHISNNNYLPVFEMIIDKWIQREVSRLSDKGTLAQCLLVFSQKLAVAIYSKRQTNGGYAIQPEEADEIWNTICSTSSLSNFYKSKSLINRDGLGVYKFSHRSFLEFFLSKEKYENNSFDFDMKSMDIAFILYKERVNRYFDDIIAKGLVYFSNTFDLNTDNDKITINGNGVNVRFLECYSNITIIEFNAKQFDSIVPFLSNTSIDYIIINDYSPDKCNINLLKEMDNIRYVKISGKSCSKSFIKFFEKKQKALIVNDECILPPSSFGENIPVDFVFSGTKVSDFAPFDYYYSNHSS